MDGEIAIGTKLDTDKFDRQITQLEKKMQKEEDKKIEIEANLTNIEQEKKNYQDLQKEAESYKKTIDKIQEVQYKRLVQGLKPRQLTDESQGIINRYTELQGILAENKNTISRLNQEEQKLKQSQEQINAKVDEYKQKIENVKLQQHVAEVDRMKEGFKGVGSSIQSSINKVARLAIGIFGIRSAYMALRRASSDLASYDQQYATNLEYIRYALTQMIAPVLRYIVNLAATLLQYIYAILNAWFGIGSKIDVSAKSFNKMKAGASGVAKAAKEIRKQLAGFDEMNVLSDQSDSGAGGGGGAGGAMPDFDLSALQGEPPAWLKWIIDNKDLILSILAGVAAGLLAWKLGLSGIKALGIGVLIAGIVYTIQSLLAYLQNPSWENFGKIIQGIGIAIIGLGILIGNVPLIIIGAIVLIVGTIVKYWNEIKGFLQNGINWLTDKSDWVHKMFGDTIGNIYDTFVSNLKLILNWFDLTINSIKGIFDGLIKFIKGVFTGDWAMAWEGIKQIFSNIWNWITGTAGTVIQILWNNLTNFATSIGNSIAGIFKAIVNAVLRTIENVLNAPIKTVNSLIGVINSIPGVNIGRLPTFNLPRLAVGGIVNMPNRGTLVGGAIAGESGKEGVLPLTDTQAMAELGREIGRWININATVPVYVGNRQIAREIKRINAEDDFAYNS